MEAAQQSAGHENDWVFCSCKAMGSLVFGGKLRRLVGKYGWLLLNTGARLLITSNHVVSWDPE